jgi:excisionase family DNA binding protein
MMTLREAADLLGVTRGRVYQWVSEGRLPVERHGERATLVRREDVLSLERRPAGRPRKSA